MNLNQFLNPNHKDIFQSIDRELIVRGGANAGKTYSIADKLLLQSIYQSDRRLKAILVRKTLPSLKKTVLDILERRANKFKLPLKINRTDSSAVCGNMQFESFSLNNQDDFAKIKSLTDVDFIWINEATEIRENDYRILKSRLRGGEGRFAQMILDFNPVGKTSWVYERFYLKDIGGARKLKYTVLDNPWAKPDEIADLKESANDDQNYYKIYFLGEWGELEGVIFNWTVGPLPSPDPGWYDEIWYGGDFGFSVDPAVVVKIYRKADKYWVEEVLYETELTNQDLGRRMRAKGVTSTDTTYWDSAEPKSIQELYEMGFDAHGAVKGADSVRAGIDFLKELDITIVEGSPFIEREQRSYIWKKDKDDNALNVPIERNNHAMSAIRYGIYTHMKDRVDPNQFRIL